LNKRLISYLTITNILTIFVQVKLFIKKYCNAKTLTVVLLLLSFNLVSFGQDINNCLCSKQKVESKHSCCQKETKKETKSCSTEKKAGDKCNMPKEKKSEKDCKSCQIDKTVQKDEGTLNESKLPIPESKIIIQESLSSTFNKTTNLKAYRSDNSPGIRSKVFLDISSLRI
jgi:hypothetical protein